MVWRNRWGLVVFCVLPLLSGCSRDGFRTQNEASFVSSCILFAQHGAASLNSAAGHGLIAPGGVAGLFLVGSRPEKEISIPLDFAPSMVLPIVGQRLLLNFKPRSSCVDAFRYAKFLKGVSPANAFRIGLNRENRMLSDEMFLVQMRRRQLSQRQINAAIMVRRLRRDLIKYAPKSLGFHVAEQNGVYVPSIGMQAVNVVGRPISAFLLSIRLVDFRGDDIGHGRVKFVPPVPLAPGVESSYVLNLSGIRGLDSKNVVTYSGAVRVILTLNDLIVSGKPLLGDLKLKAQDQLRMDALNSFYSSLLKFRSFVYSIDQVSNGDTSW